MTSLKWMFIHESHSTMWPLYVSPDLSSTSCAQGGMHSCMGWGLHGEAYGGPELQAGELRKCR